MKKYLNAIKAEFPFYGPKERKYIKDFKSEVINDSSSHLTYDDLVQKFGEPCDIADQYFTEVNLSDYKKKISVRKKVVFICTLVALSTLSILVISYLEGRNSYIDREVIEIIDQGESSEN